MSAAVYGRLIPAYRGEEKCSWRAPTRDSNSDASWSTVGGSKGREGVEAAEDVAIILFVTLETVYSDDDVAVNLFVNIVMK